ncbi:MAG: hypothetical protein R3E12_09255 [Candidatus Eisenbacteria bacterium]
MSKTISSSATTESWGQTETIFQFAGVAPDGVVTPFGPPTPDPDAVVIDDQGVFGPPGSVIVSGNIAGCPSACIGRVTVIAPDGIGEEAVAEGGCLGNNQDLAVALDGSILAANNSRGNVCRVQPGGSVSQFLAPVGTENLAAIEVGDDGGVYLSWDGLVRRFDSNGLLLDAEFSTGRAMAFGPPGPFYGVIVGDAGQLWAIDPTTKERKFIVDSTAEDIAFDSNGNLYMARQFEWDILKVSVVGGCQSELAEFLGPIPYSSHMDAPDLGSECQFVYLEDFEDMALNTLGVVGFGGEPS